MIEYIKGRLDELKPTLAIVETSGGVGYSLSISLNTYTALQGKEEAKLYVFESIREDAYVLFGFANKQERELFALLLGVSGVGGQTARTIVSAFTPAELSNIIINEDARLLKTVKGIGPKAASRIIIELKDKIRQVEISVDGGVVSAGKQDVQYKEVVDEAVAALTMLGFPPAMSHKTAVQIAKDNPGIPVEQIIKQALKML